MKSPKRLFAVFTFLMLLAWNAISLPVSAAQLTSRNIQVSTATPSAVANHSFQFTYASISTLGSVAFEYCENSPVPAYTCDAPAGLDVSSSTLTGQSGNVGFTIDGVNTTANRLVLTRIAAAAAAVASSYSFSGVINPSSPGSSQFVRIYTYASTDGSGAYTDNGSVAFATITPITVGAFVPPYLIFCVGLTVALDCSAANGSNLDLGSLSVNQASAAQSQFATGTNDPAGYSVYGLGTTMTSGNNVIPALNTPTPSLPGISQFGINLRDNVSPQIGEEPAGAGSAIPTNDYNTPNFFTYRSGDAIATSTSSTEFNRMTASYVVNVSNNQPVGVYSTTITYLAVAQF